MAPLSIQTYVVGPVQTNCYFAINDDTKEVLIIDPGASAKQLAEKVKEQGLKPVAILLTHGHFDHATGAGELAQLLHIKIYAQEKEKETLECIVGQCIARCGKKDERRQNGRASGTFARRKSFPENP